MLIELVVLTGQQCNIKKLLPLKHDKGSRIKVKNTSEITWNVETVNVLAF